MPGSHCFTWAHYLKLPALNAGVAQLVERLTCNEDVAGSIPAGGSFLFGEVPEWPKGTDCKSVGIAFGGSNPPLSTLLARALFVLNSGSNSAG